MKKSEFVKKFKPFAKKTEAQSGISATFILAQAAIESAWGEKAPGNMFFGIKAKKYTPEDKKQLLITREVLSDAQQGAKFPVVISMRKLPVSGKWEYKVKDWFRAYETPEESFTDHCRFFLENKRYAEALKVRHDPYLFADAIAKAKYASAPNYAEVLKSVIKSIESLL